MAYIDLLNIKKTYCGKTLFDNFNLSIDTGEFLGILGPSGSGKTTLLNIIGLITDISSGSVNIDGIKNLKANSKSALMLRRSTIGYLFQNYGLIDDETVSWNLKLAFEYKKLKKSEKEKRINKVAEQFKLSDCLNKKIYMLSGGQQQRVAVMRLLLQESRIILADEPTSSLDKDNEKIIMGELKRLNDAGITVIMVTHNRLLEHYFTRKIILDELMPG